MISAGAFEPFFREFEPDAEIKIAVEVFGSSRLQQVNGFRQFLDEAPGSSFDGGLYRLHGGGSARQAAESISEEFSGYRGRFEVFAYDWLGRNFVLDFGRVQGSEPQVSLVDHGAGEILEIPRGFVDFHTEELAEYREEALSVSFFEMWKNKNRKSLPILAGKCVGYDIPLFLGGADVVENLTVVDSDIYWSLCAQLKNGVIKLDSRARISQVSIRHAP